MTKTSLRGLKSNTFEAGKNIKLVKSAIIFGPNASGKSSFLRAFKALEYLVLRSAHFKPNEKIAPYEPYKLNTRQSSAPVNFEIEFVNKVRYEYLVSFSSDYIVSEELFHYPN
ncbi:MAG: ATP-binding protein, partial [Bacteroidetes bacterium]|nr:ATP-binding protein [Bacteroidota bacterium]